MSGVTRIVLDEYCSQKLEFQDINFPPRITYYYNPHENKKTKWCSKGTRLVDFFVNHEKVNSAIAFGQGGFFLLTNSDKTRMGKNYL